MAESYYELEPEDPLTKEETKVLKALEKLNNTKAETNSAFNETQNANRFAQAYKTIAPPEDYEPQTSNLNGTDSYTGGYKEKYKNKQSPELNEDLLSKFNKANDVLKKQTGKTNNANSTIGFSLKNRTKQHIPIPVYLCEENGKIVVTITVNAAGNVIDAYVNNASTSNNACLIEHALDYAKQSTFSADAAKPSQIGTITFNFIGKN